MSQLNHIKRENSPDQVYYDVTISNFQSQNTIPPVFYYNESRTVPFVNCPEDYYLSIVRFSVDTGTIPLFLPSIVPNQSDPDKTIYTITLTYKGDNGVTYTSGTTHIVWVPQDTSIPKPEAPNLTPNKLQIDGTGYYCCYSYQYLATLVNTAFKLALDRLVIAVNAGIGAGSGGMPVYTIWDSSTSTAIPLQSDTLPPIFQWDTSSDTATIFAIPQYDLNPAVNPGTSPVLSGNEPIKIFFNAPLFGLFNSFPSTIFGYSTFGGHTNFQISVVNQGGLNTSLITPPLYDTIETGLRPVSIPYISVYQETSTISSLSPVTAIVFTSNTMPITPNQVSNPVILSDNQQLGTSTNNANFANIITDLVSETGSYRPSLVYTPSAQYRLVSLNGNTPLYNLDLQIFYRLRNGDLVPFRLASGGSVTVKLAFLKKDNVGTNADGTANPHGLTSPIGTKKGVR
jgi:hypothetical protein